MNIDTVECFSSKRRDIPGEQPIMRLVHAPTNEWAIDAEVVAGALNMLLAEVRALKAEVNGLNERISRTRMGL